MKTILTIAVLVVSISSVTFVQSDNVENPTLQKVLTSMIPKLHDFALAAKFVRKTYMPQTVEDFAANKKLDIKRTTISEIIVNIVKV